MSYFYTKFVSVDQSLLWGFFKEKFDAPVRRTRNTFVGIFVYKRHLGMGLMKVVLGEAGPRV